MFYLNTSKSNLRVQN